jgi:hypothetical protein
VAFVAIAKLGGQAGQGFIPVDQLLGDQVKGILGYIFFIGNTGRPVKILIKISLTDKKGVRYLFRSKKMSLGNMRIKIGDELSL